MKLRLLAAIGLSAGLLSIAPAFAGEVIVTSPSGVFTNPGSANASGPGAGFDTWFANNVRNSGSVGITTTYPRSGNGSIEFSGPANAKADFEYYFSANNVFLLSDLNAFSYDWYRSSSSTASAQFEPSLRLYVSDGTHTGYLVYEGIYNGEPSAPVNTFTSVDVMPDYVWSTGTLPDAFSNYTRTIADWAALLPGLKVYGLSTGIGSGWDGSFDGAVDNVTFGTTQGGTTTFNFEVAGGVAVPEPMSIALLGVGVVGMLAARRRVVPGRA